MESDERRPPMRAPLLVACLILLLELVVVGGPHLSSLLHRSVAQHVASRARGPFRVALVPAVANDVVEVAPPSTDYGPVPKRVPVFWGVESSRLGWLVAFDWSGRAVGTLKTGRSWPAGAQNPPAPSPDGETLVVDGTFLDVIGRVVAKPALPAGAFVWEAASQGLCGWGPQLWTYRVGGAGPRLVRTLPRNSTIVGCSFRRDLALVVTQEPKLPASDLWWVSLRDGTIIRHRSYAGVCVGNVVASRDLSVYAENFCDFAGPAAVTTIRRVSDGTVIATRSDVVFRFSADGGELTTVESGSVFKVSSGAPVWITPDNAVTTLLFPGPTGGEFLVAGVISTRQDLLEIVDSSGRAIPVSSPPLDTLLLSA